MNFELYISKTKLSIIPPILACLPVVPISVTSPITLVFYSGPTQSKRVRPGPCPVVPYSLLGIIHIGGSPTLKSKAPATSSV